MKIDEINIAIIKQLRDGRKSFKKIADELSLTVNTVKARVNRLRNEGVLDIAGLVNPAALPGHTVIFLCVKLKTMNLVKKGEEFGRLKGVVSVSVVTGRYDLIAIALLDNNLSLLQFFTEEVSKIDEVSSTETFVVYQSCNMKVPYTL
jgi:Lrp/AsnC family transcriptional regulator for asnA, asnC and gidA